MLSAPFDPNRPVSRWTQDRKQALLAALDEGQITIEDIQLIHDIGPDELAEWHHRNGEGGDAGRARLRVTRKPPEARPAKPRKKRKLKRDFAPKPAETPIFTDEPEPQPPIVLRPKYTMTVGRYEEPALTFDFSGTGCQRRMRTWFDMYLHNARHNNTIASVVVVDRAGFVIERWQR